MTENLFRDPSTRWFNKLRHIHNIAGKSQVRPLLTGTHRLTHRTFLVCARKPKLLISKQIVWKVDLRTRTKIAKGEPKATLCIFLFTSENVNENNTEKKNIPHTAHFIFLWLKYSAPTHTKNKISMHLKCHTAKK
jgi:hypothetical protein